MQRIMVIGNAGGGKSTLSRRLAKATGIPHLAIDQIQWQPGWVKTPQADYDTAHAEWISRESWLIDGVGSWPSVMARLQAADTIILVDLPFWRHLWWATKRQVASLFVGRIDGPPGSPMWKVTLRLYHMMFWLHRKMLPGLRQAVWAQHPRARVIVLRRKRDIAAFLAREA